MKIADQKLMRDIKQYCTKFSPEILKQSNLNKAAYSEINLVGNAGKPSKRLMIILLAKGCMWAKAGGPCTMCNYWILRDEKVNDKNLVTQFKAEIGKHDFIKEDIREIAIFVSGSFLCENEISINAQNEILKLTAKIKTLDKVMVEGRAIYVDKNRILQMKKILGKIKLEIGLGLESSNDFIRNVVINKGLSKTIFEKAVRIIGECKVSLLVYVLIKPPFITEREAIKDSIKTARYVFKLAQKYNIPIKVDLEPVHIKPATIVNDLYEKNEYSSPWLWSVIEVLKKISKHKYSQILLSTEGYEMYQKPKNCPACQDKVVEAINKYNIKNDLSVFDGLDCKCKNKWKKEITKLPKCNLRKRVNNFLDRNS